VISRFGRHLVSAGWFLGSAALSVLWAIHCYTYVTEETIVGDLFRFGPLGVSLSSFVHWGWISVIALLLWAFHSTEKMHRGRRDRQVAAATSNTGSLGQAGFATSEDLRRAGLTGAKFGQGIRLGFDKDTADVIRYKGEAHGIMVAPARSGKFRDVLCAMTLEWKHSMVIIDPKGQIAAVTKKEREKLGRVFVLNPFDVWPEYLGPTACYNPMSALDPQSKSFDAECDALADAIVVHEGSGDAHWNTFEISFAHRS
jgi:type IV secretory pathway TraG/TraD family ATPase VirD4